MQTSVPEGNAIILYLMCCAVKSAVNGNWSRDVCNTNELIRRKHYEIWCHQTSSRQGFDRSATSGVEPFEFDLSAVEDEAVSVRSKQPL